MKVLGVLELTRGSSLLQMRQAPFTLDPPLACRVRCMRDIGAASYVSAMLQILSMHMQFFCTIATPLIKQKRY